MSIRGKSRAVLWSVSVLTCLHAGLADADQISARSQTVQHLSEQQLYSGWRASRLLDSRVFSKDGKSLGQVRNVVVANSGQIEFLVSEQAGIGTLPEFVFRVPWTQVVKPIQPGIVLADVPDIRSKDLGLFGPQFESKDSRETFLITKVIGDYVRLQTGHGYGYVSDVVFGQDGRMLAVLVSREAFAGGGIFAFPYPGQTGKWDPGMSYYGLPYITDEQANASGLRVDRARFGDNRPG